MPGHLAQSRAAGTRQRDGRTARPIPGAVDADSLRERELRSTAEGTRPAPPLNGESTQPSEQFEDRHFGAAHLGIP
jgi:hypothetical protein